MSSLGGSLAGSFVGTAIGNALTGNHGGGSTVVNTGSTGTPAMATNGVQSGSNLTDSGFSGTPNAAFNNGQVKKENGVWSFIGDVIGFLVLISILGAFGFLIFTVFSRWREGRTRTKHDAAVARAFNLNDKFWDVQNAFAKADVEKLKSLLGPEMLESTLKDLSPSTLNIASLSYEVRLEALNELSIWYTFYEHGSRVDQVWHFDKLADGWKLVGLENV